MKLGGFYGEMWKSPGGEWFWHLVATNEQVVADCGNGYSNRAECARMFRRVNPNPLRRLHVLTGQPKRRSRRRST